MSRTKFLNELMMKNKPYLKLNKKYFFGLLATLAIQMTLGVSLVSAMICENEIEKQWRNSHTFGDGGKEYYGISTYYTSVKSIEEVKKDYIENSKWLTSPDERDPTKQGWQRMNGDKYKTCKDFALGLYNEAVANNRVGNVCVAKFMVDNNCKNIDLQNQISSSNQQYNIPSNSGSSSQSNKKANRQSANSQSNQNTSNKPHPDPMGEIGDVLDGVIGNQTSSNSSDQIIKKMDEAVDKYNSADEQKDYATALTALKTIIANTPDKKQKAQALTFLGGYYKFGYGVPKDEVRGQALFEQASMDGNIYAYGHICDNYLNGRGVTENHQKAISYCTKAANGGDLVSMAKLGWIYAAGTGTQNEQLAKEWICKAAQKGHAGSIKNVQKLNFNCN